MRPGMRRVISIQVSAERDGGHVAIAVADEGRGVPQERLPQLFRKHARFDRGSSGLGGTGWVFPSARA